MAVFFEKVSRFADVDLPLPQRGTSDSAGYDFIVAEDVVLPPYEWFMTKLRDAGYNKLKADDYWGFLTPFSLDEMAKLVKETKVKVPLVSTGMKCHLDKGQYLQLSVRSSTPLKHWIILANSVGVIDADYYNNPENEGEIFAQLINMTPFAIQLKRGDRVVQGIIKSYGTTDSDQATTLRTGGMGSTGN